MPKGDEKAKASRTLLEITAIRIEKVQDISQQDAWAG
tara:strand:+ start:2407 stop:2517 length:111 start_codon:yes stop_codon:yes gene_type:complete